MKKSIFTICVVLSIVLVFHTAYAEETPHRIISLAPNITEILFALGLGENIVGVTNFCDYPEEAMQKPKVGGMTNPGPW